MSSSKTPTHEEPNQSDDMDARVKDPNSPGQYRSGVDGPGEPTKKNPGHTNPAHNTPGHERSDKPSTGHSDGRTQSAAYPGVRGPETHKMAEESKPPTEPTSEKHPETIHPNPDKSRQKPD